jgi:hypothetical protein
MIFEASPRVEALLEATDPLDDLTLEQVERRKDAIWSSPEAVALEASPGRRTCVAEGDSWFDYLPGLDILDHLREMGHAVAKVARAGDTLENMVYGTAYERNYSRRPSPLAHTLQLMRELEAPVLLFSGGGNDLAGDELEAFLNHKGMGLGELRTDYVEYVLGTVVRTAYLELIHRVSEASASAHIITHGYGHPVPDGRGVINLPWGWTFIGPWLRPAFTKKNYVEASERSRIMEQLVDRFNQSLRELAENHRTFHYIDLRPLINESSWVNELHLKNSAYRLVAVQFDQITTQVLRS